VATSRTSPPASQGPFTLRGWLVVAGGAATAAVILAAWLPLGALLQQRAQLSSTSSRIAQVAAESRQVAAETKDLRSPVAQAQLGRLQYQLALPGQRLLLVESASPTAGNGASGDALSGDPGLAPLAEPGTALGTTSGTSGGHGATAHPGTSGAPSGGFLSRVLGTLEFWR